MQILDRPIALTQDRRSPPTPSPPNKFGGEGSQGGRRMAENRRKTWAAPFVDPAPSVDPSVGGTIRQFVNLRDVCRLSAIQLRPLHGPRVRRVSGAGAGGQVEEQSHPAQFRRQRHGEWFVSGNGRS